MGTSLRRPQPYRASFLFTAKHWKLFNDAHFDALDNPLA